jgi:hypothetical protein
MTLGLAVGVYVVVHLVSVYMLVVSRTWRDLFGRARVPMQSSDESEVLAAVPGEWLDNHEFWELTQVEEVAF